jgi:hypothetical protein
MSQSSSLLKWKADIFLETKIILGLIFLINMIKNPNLYDYRSPIAFYDSNYPWTLNMYYGTFYVILSKFWAIFWAHLHFCSYCQNGVGMPIIV